MVEPLHMHHLSELLRRLRAGESQRRVALDLGFARETVAKYQHLAAGQGLLDLGRPLPDEETLRALLQADMQPPKTPSSIAPYRDVVEALLQQDVEMVAIHARLCQDYGYTGSYSSLRRYVAREHPSVPQVTIRVHSAPGEEAQVDFGTVGMLFDPRSGCVRRAYVFVGTLSYSRHMYAELVFDQTIPTWIACHLHAFALWGGVPGRIVPDNLKAAVKQAAIDDPVLGEAYRRLALHCDFLVSPTRPAMPQHKGKVESGVHYIKRNFFAGREFLDIDMANRELQTWLRETAGSRIHGTTRQAPWRLFTEHERPALKPLPQEPFTLVETKLAKVHPDCHVVLDGSYYSAPYRFCGQTLEAHIHQASVMLYDGASLVSTHVRASVPGQWCTRLDHYPEAKSAYLSNTPQICRQRATEIGPATFQVVDQLLNDRPLDRLRSVQGLLRLEETVGPDRLERACARAIYYGQVSYRRIKEILNAALDCEPLPDSLDDNSDGAITEHFAFARDVREFLVLPEEAQR